MAELNALLLNAVTNEVAIKIYMLRFVMKHRIMSQGNSRGVVAQKAGWWKWMDPEF